MIYNMAHILEVNLFVIVVLSFVSTATSIKCYVCEGAATDCRKNVEKLKPIECQSGDIYCKVERFKMNDHVQKFVRECAAECHPECKEMAGTGKCIGCCTTDACNTGNSAPESTKVALKTLLFLTSLTLGVFYRPIVTS